MFIQLFFRHYKIYSSEQLYEILILQTVFLIAYINIFSNKCTHVYFDHILNYSLCFIPLKPFSKRIRSYSVTLFFKIKIPQLINSIPLLLNMLFSVWPHWGLSDYAKDKNSKKSFWYSQFNLKELKYLLLLL